MSEDKILIMPDEKLDVKRQNTMKEFRQELKKNRHSELPDLLIKS